MADNWQSKFDETQVAIDRALKYIQGVPSPIMSSKGYPYVKLVPVYNPEEITGLNDPERQFVNGELLGYSSGNPITQLFETADLCFHNQRLAQRCELCWQISLTRSHPSDTRYRGKDQKMLIGHTCPPIESCRKCQDNYWEKKKRKKKREIAMATTKVVCLKCDGRGYKLSSLGERRECRDCTNGIVRKYGETRTISIPSDHTSDWDFWVKKGSTGSLYCKCGTEISVHRDYLGKHRKPETDDHMAGRLFDKFMAHKLPEFKEADRFDQVWDECFPREKRNSRVVAYARATPVQIKKGFTNSIEWAMDDHPLAGAIIFTVLFTAVFMGMFLGVASLAGGL